MREKRAICYTCADETGLRVSRFFTRITKIGYNGANMHAVRGPNTLAERNKHAHAHQQEQRNEPRIDDVFPPHARPTAAQ